MHIKIGTRASKLAIAQTEIFIHQLKSKADFTYEIVKIKTSGDKILDRPLYDCGGKSLFLKELEDALLKKEIDCAVHSLKDVPGRMPDKLKIVALLKREEPYDMLVCKSAQTIASLPEGARVGTSSMRRKAMVQRIRPDIRLENIRGNILTRLDKWRESELDAIILAEAGLSRLGLVDSNYCHRLDVSEILPAVGQGVVAIEAREEDEFLIALCKQIHNEETGIVSAAERGFLEYLDASCDVPLAAYAQIKGSRVIVDYMLASNDFSKFTEVQKSTDKFAESYQLGVKAAQELQQIIKSRN